jgi:hypothetical protein
MTTQSPNASRDSDAPDIAFLLAQVVGALKRTISRFNTQPIPAPVNACHLSSWKDSHDSESSVNR